MSRTPFRPETTSWFAYLLLACGLSLVAILAASIASRAASTPTPTGTPGVSHEAVAADYILPPTDEGRAQFGNIFVAEVVAFVREEPISTSDPEDLYRVLLYDVQVDESLKGDASGRVRISYDDFNGAPDVQQLSVGHRYQFFAGYDPDTNRYPVDATVGVIPIESDRQAAELAATFEPLILQAERQAEREARQASVVASCEPPSGLPVISVEPQVGPAGTQVRVTGGPFIRPEVPVSWNGKDGFLAAAPVAEDCTINIVVTIPDATEGEHRILVYDADGNQDTVKFTVTRR